MGGLHQLIFREPGLCEAGVAEKCQKLVTGLEKMEVIDVSPLLFLSFPLSLPLQNTVRQRPPATGHSKAEEGWVVKPRKGRWSGPLFPGDIFSPTIPNVSQQGPDLLCHHGRESVTVTAGAHLHHSHRDSPWKEPSDTAGTYRQLRSPEEHCGT